MFALATPISPRHARVTRSTPPVGHARRGIARWAAGATLVLVGAAAQAQGVDWTLIGGASDTARVRQVGVVAGWTRPAPLWQGDAWRLRLRHEGVLAAWHVPQARDVVELGYSPVLRLERPLADSRATFFVEGSIGARLLSHTRVGPDHDMSTAFQFSDELRAGWTWGDQGRHTAGLRLQHLSNLGIKEPNPGINFWQLYYRYRF
mgnify:CR=1 FL=1